MKLDHYVAAGDFPPVIKYTTALHKHVAAKAREILPDAAWRKGSGSEYDHLVKMAQQRVKGELPNVLFDALVKDNGHRFLNILEAVKSGKPVPTSAKKGQTWSIKKSLSAPFSDTDRLNFLLCGSTFHIFYKKEDLAWWLLHDTEHSSVIAGYGRTKRDAIDNAMQTYDTY